MSKATVFKANKMDRRQFLTATGGFLLAFTLEAGEHPALADGTGPASVTAWIRIGRDESITILVGGGEMGQGIYSGLAQGAAEELMVDWSRVRVEPVAASLSWLTGGSSGIRRRLQSMRVAGAAAREMLIAAAAQVWGVPASSCRAAQGVVTNTTTNATLTYGALAERAARIPVPANPPLVPDNAFRLIGQSVPRPDLPAKTDGSAIYGLDVVLPGMVFAVIKHCPTLGGTLAAAPTAPSGSLGVVPLSNAVAVLATNTWKAMQAASQLQVNWTIPTSASSVDSTLFLTQAQQLLASGPAVIAEQQGDVAGAFRNAARVLDNTYTLPYLAHACMEVLNCTVRLTRTAVANKNGSSVGKLIRCEIWAPTQAPNLVLSTAMAVTGLTAGKIQVYPTLMGGGLGRKFETDYVEQALRVALAIDSPVKLTWPRPEDMGHDQYRPMAMVRVQTALDGAGNILGWLSRNASPSISFQRGRLPANGVDSSAVEGLVALAYAFGSRQVEYARHAAPVPVGYWRSVGNSINAFVTESSIDEAALAAGIDPLVMRQRLLANSPRHLAVLNAAAALGNWGSAPPAGRARGIALVESFGSIVAEVAEISQPAAGSIKVHNIACVIDCGRAINPNSVEAQMQSGIFHGLSAALWGEVTFRAGRASARNFSNYRVLRMLEAPNIAVQIIQSGAALGGVGEPAVPPIAPAVANAYARLTGQRVRTLPFFPGATMGE